MSKMAKCHQHIFWRLLYIKLIQYDIDDNLKYGVAKYHDKKKHLLLNNYNALFAPKKSVIVTHVRQL